jgi:hypothetical protein
MIRIVYYCRYPRNPDELPRSSQPFTTEQEARGEAKLLAGAGYWGAIEKHHEFKQDHEHDDVWHVDWEGAGDKAIETLDDFYGIVPGDRR